MPLDPVTSDINATTYPDTLVTLHVVQKTLQGGEASRAPNKATVQADGHHLGGGVTFGIQHIERILQIGEEMVTGSETRRRGTPHVIAIERIRDDQVWPGRSVRRSDRCPARRAAAGVS